MKMRKSEHFVRSSSSIVGQTFNVKMTDKLFETLFSSLYKYKEAASLRETLSNGNDSHNMRDRQQRVLPSYYASLTPPPQQYSKHLAPKGTLVRVHLPDEMEPWLEIKDFGVGLSLESIIGEPITAREDEVLVEGNLVVKEDEIPDSVAVIGVPAFYEGNLVFRSEDGEIIRGPGLYTTLFNSTKEDDNDQIGAFGLGSKSPFAVSDSFTVESRWEGKVYRFLMYLNANRIPTVDLITKDLDTRDPLPEDTDEFNGLTIKVPVKNSRFRSFQDELVRLGKVMRPDQRPIVENADYWFQWENIRFDNSVGNTYIQPKSEGTTHYAVMGGVSYPIDLEQLDPDVSSIMEKFPTSYTFFELGELNVPPSREDLSYDEYTRDSLNREFKAVSKMLMQEKIKELRFAESLGPLALYMKKVQLSDSFGSGFRKMMERDFPADSRFVKGEFKYTGRPEIVRDFSIDAPFRSIGLPYELEIYNQWSEAGSLINLNHVEQWRNSPEKTRIALIIDNSTRARNLKIKTARDNFDVVIVAKPNGDYTHHRNLLKTNKEAFTNHEELKAYFESWIGVQETTTDNLVFADKIVEVFSDLFDPDEVYFMHEMEYVKPPVEKDPGMFKFNMGSFYFDGDVELSGDDVSKIIERGEKIVYIEISGRECIHRIHGRSVNQSTASNLRDVIANTLIGDDKTPLLQYIGAYKYIVLARRKSVPMMKKFPEVFVPLDQVFDILMQHFKPRVEAVEAKNMLRCKKQLRCMMHRMNYGARLLQESHGHIDERYSTLFSRAGVIMSTAESQLSVQEWSEIKVKSKHKIVGKVFNDFIGIVRNLNIQQDAPDNVKEFRRSHTMLAQTFGAAVEYLRGDGFANMEPTSTVSQGYKMKNRYRVECHRFVRFMMENYTPSAHNLIEDAGKFVQAISKRILGA